MMWSNRPINDIPATTTTITGYVVAALALIPTQLMMWAVADSTMR